MWFTMALVAIVLGLILFSSVQESIPPELEWLFGRKEASVAPAPAPQNAGAPRLQGQGWQTRTHGAVSEVVRPFAYGAQVGAYRYDPPLLGIMCDGKSLHVRIDALAPVTGREESPVVFAGQSEGWYRATGTNILSPDPRATAKAILAAKEPISVQLSYVDTGLVTLPLPVEGLAKALEAFPAECKRGLSRGR